MIRGRIIAESLRIDTAVHVDGVRLVGLSRHDVSASTLPPDEQRDGQEQHGAVDAQPDVWTFVDIEAPKSQADELARALAESLEPELGWYADFTVNDTERVVVFAGRVFRYRIGDKAARAEAVAWGRAAGTPEHQLDWGA
jgi:hypothetical protein